ncbi:hypothetical protein I3842_11G091700 [Carya illinoinensis]|uniref:C2H2-type domain-containing protein n=1 Tax=Carya illinoinensis TaxID=32201 RepID=A0A922DNG9_CARIL|nr:hypothetical protein I3842_11G091700 [Carya illinoinensis]
MIHGRREFRSAQALGGHMNVHRRDRVRLNQPQPNSNNPTSSSPSITSSFIIPTQEYSTNGGLCLLSQSPNPSTGAFTSRVSENASQVLILLAFTLAKPKKHHQPQIMRMIKILISSFGSGRDLCHYKKQENMVYAR